MCFQISPKQVRPNQRIAYKVMRTTDRGRLTSLVYSARSANRKVGTVLERDRGQTSSDSGSHSRHGIYVYLTLERAKQECGENQSWGNRVVVQCRVRPTDFIHHGLRSRRKTRVLATYEKVVLEKVL